MFLAFVSSLDKGVTLQTMANHVAGVIQALKLFGRPLRQPKQAGLR